MIRSVAMRFSAVALALCASSAALFAQLYQITSSPKQLVFGPGTSTVQSFRITAPATGYFAANVSPNLAGLVSVSPTTPTLVSTGGTDVTVTVVSNAFTANVTGSIVISSLSAGLTGTEVPVTLSPTGTGTGTGTGTVNFTPSPVIIGYVPGSTTSIPQSITLTSGVNVTLNASLDTNLAPYVSLGSATVNSNGVLTLTVNPQNLPTSNSISGMVTLTPTIAGTVPPVTIPVTLQPSGFGSTSNITPSPTSVTFNYSAGTTASQMATVTLTAPLSVQLTPTFSPNLAGAVVAPLSLSSNGSFTITLQTPQTFTSPVSGSVTLTPAVSGTGLTPLTIPINITPNGVSTGTLIATPSALNFNYAPGQTLSQTQYVQTSAPQSVTLTAALSGNLTGFVSVPSTVTANSSIPVTLQFPASVTTAISGTLTLTPPVGSGLSTATVVITINPNGQTGTSLTTSPSSLTYTYPVGTTLSQVQYLLISAPVQTNVTITASSNLTGYLQFPATAANGQQIAVTLVNPQAVPVNTTGSLTLTPITPGLSAITVPVYINASASPGGGQITATPASVTFNMQAGGSAPAPQTVTLTNPNNISDFITVTVTSDNNFLTVGQSSSSTPSTLTLNVNPSALPNPGVYNATITVVRLSGGAVLGTIPVTVNVTPAVRVTPSPTSATLTSFVGATTAVTQAIQVGGDATQSFTATATTASGGNWLTVTPTSGSLGASVTVSANASGLAAGIYNGNVTISVGGAAAATIPVTFTVNPAASLQLSSTNLSFAAQTNSVSPPAVQTVSVTASGSQALNYTATATSTGGWLSVSPASGTTPGSLTVSVNRSGLSAGSYTGSISVASPAAGNSPQTINVTLTVSTATPNVTAVLSAASLTPTVTTPGEVLTIRGTDLGPATGAYGSISNGAITTSAGGVTVTFDGVAAPILYASATQINLIAPYEIASRATTRVVVTNSGQASRETELRVGDTAPALFTATMSGTGPAAALNQDGSVNSAANPETRGRVVVLYGTGEGLTSPASTTGQLSSATLLRRPTAAVNVTIGGQPAIVDYIGSAPTLVSGVFQLNVRIPTNIGAGAQPVDIQIGSGKTQTTVTVFVQ